ncbi:MAG: hypothetical protein ACFNKL_07705, partial [Treponema sp.]
STRVATWASRWDTFWNAGGDNFQGLHAKIAPFNLTSSFLIENSRIYGALARTNCTAPKSEDLLAF